MKQIIITKAIKDAIQRTPYGSTDGQLGKAKVIARLFYPRGDNAFLIVEGGHNKGQKWDGNTVYGWVKLDGGEFEAGRFSLSELLTTKAQVKWAYGDFEVGIERDTCVDINKKTVLECMGDNAPDWVKPVVIPEVHDKESAIEAIAAATVSGERISNQVENEIKAKTPAAAPAISADTLKDHPEPADTVPGAWEPDNWQRMTDWNNHNGVRIAICKWAEKNATSEREELALMLDDYRHIESEHNELGAMSKELIDFRNELDDELAERITRVFGADKWQHVSACL